MFFGRPEWAIPPPLLVLSMNDENLRLKIIPPYHSLCTFIVGRDL